jgi:thioredoxin-dependent peroxiredoxin
MKVFLLFLLSFLVNGYVGYSQQKHLTIGDSVPSFSLQDQDNKTFTSEDYTGRYIMVIYFYPKDESAICTKEACSFRDSFTEFTKAGAIVVGINQAPVETHKKFQEHHHLPFFLLSDPENKVLKQFGVKGKFWGTGRETFVVDKKGKIVFRFDSFTKGKEHREQALKVIKGLNP